MDFRGPSGPCPRESPLGRGLECYQVLQQKGICLAPASSRPLSLTFSELPGSSEVKEWVSVAFTRHHVTIVRSLTPTSFHASIIFLIFFLIDF